MEEQKEKNNNVSEETIDEQIGCLKDITKYSPMMQSYINTKSQNIDAILFYRLGDFYEMFFNDAKIVSKELELTLTGRECGTSSRAPMCGVPYHSATTYIDKLVKLGHKVAICEQLEDPKQAKGIVKRGVIRIITPGTVTNEGTVLDSSNNYIMCALKLGTSYGISIVDITTGEFKLTSIKDNFAFDKLLDEIAKYNPKELLVNKVLLNSKNQMSKITQKFDVFISLCDDKSYTDKFKIEFSNKKLRTYSIYLNNSILDNSAFIESKDYELERLSSYAIIEYLQDTQKIELTHINKMYIYENKKYMALDTNARKSLEINERLKDGSKKGTLFNVLNKTKTPMGLRLLSRWINEPLLDVAAISNRQDCVEEFLNNPILSDEILEILNDIYDIERLCSKLSYKIINAKDLVSLKCSIRNLPKLKEKLSSCNSSYLKYIYKKLDTLDDLCELIQKSIIDDPPLTIKDGEIIKKGYNSNLDELKDIANNSKSILGQLEFVERQKTGIKNLRISYNKVFGYFFEVTKSNLNLVPNYFIRKQTLTNAERFVTPELKELEEKILNASEQISTLEYNLFVGIRDKILQNVKRIQKASNIIATLDCLLSLARVANDYDYIRPNVIEDGELVIKDGRHPVIEKMIGNNNFIPNDTTMDSKNFFHIITRPNMAGKSTYMRQVALIVLMAQIGSFVPATSATIPIVDKIMTRVGAQDDLSMGESTFMVEMMEVANILKCATKKSLLILDEIGRGTSTYDGMAIAHSVAQYIAQNICSKTLFATHYHELTQMKDIPGIKNYHIQVKENGDDVVFLRKIIEGGTDKSFGIHVAKLAGIPDKVIKDANNILKNLEKGELKLDTKTKSKTDETYNLFNMNLVQIADELNDLDLNIMTPISAFNFLNKIKNMI